MRARCDGLRVTVLLCRVTGWGFRVKSTGFSVCGLRASGCAAEKGLHPTAYRVKAEGYGVEHEGCGLRVTGLRVEGSQAEDNLGGHFESDAMADFGLRDLL